MLSLVLVCAASWWVFEVLTERATSSRRRLAFAEWARANRFKLHGSGHSTAPAPLGIIGLKAFTILLDSRTTIAELGAADSTAGAVGTTPASGLEGASPSTDAKVPQNPTLPARWHAIIMKLDGEWPPTGLRPAHAPASLLDFFSLSSFPLLGLGQRFVVFGTDSAAARRLSKSSARALLPPDVGLLLHGSLALLDFSSRPFDPIEFGRMLALANQVIAKLPRPVEHVSKASG
jgi:hypothetical protein